MYGRRRYRGYRGNGRQTGAVLQAVLWAITAVCIVVVCVAMAIHTKASQVVAAEPMVLPVSVTVRKEEIVDLARETVSEMERAGESAAIRMRAEKERAIVIDAGHGGMDGGCVFDDVTEKDINRRIAWEVVKKLRDRGYRAELARKGDDYVEKIDRVAYANRTNALLYVSIHQNSCEVGSVSGIETWYGENGVTEESRQLAQFVQQETVSATGAVSRELVSDDELCVINKSHMPSCLIETGFLSNKDERGKLCTEEYREKIAEGIVRGIERYLKVFP